jgi:hypothetical protein
MNLRFGQKNKFLFIHDKSSSKVTDKKSSDNYIWSNLLDLVARDDLNPIFFKLLLLHTD